MDIKNKNILIAYFSRSGMNYSNGKIVDLSIGNTEVVSNLIAELTGASRFKIEPLNAYPADYEACTEAAKSELRANSRPEIALDIDAEYYDIIFLGYPNWWNTMPMPVWTFLEGHNLRGKTILPFCTHEGSGMGSSERDLKMLCPDSDIRKGLAITGSHADRAEAAVKKWIDEV